MNKSFTSKKLPLAIMLASGFMASPVIAEETKSTIALEEVVVTAQKREQNLQETPISISTFDAGAMEQQNIYDIGDISQYTPNVQIAETPGGSTGATIAIRGSVTVNPVVTIDTNVGVYMDGVFIAKNVGGLFDVAELERIEVLRGPQGTLYGKNTVGGAVNMVTRKPSGEVSGRIRVGAGNYGSTDLFATADSATYMDKLSFNVAISKKDRDGFYDNNSTNPEAAQNFKELDSIALRFAANYDISESVNLYYTYDESEKDNTPTMAQVGGDPDERFDEAALDGVKYDKSESSGHAVNVTWGLNESLTFKSITAYREMTFDDANDYDGSDLLFFHAERHADQEQLSQEFQLIGKSDSVDYVLGAFYFDEKVSVENPLTAGVDINSDFMPDIFIERPNSYGADSTSVALFGQADWHVNDKLTLTAGARWTEEEKEGFSVHPNDIALNPPGGPYPYANYSVKTSDSWSNFSPMAVASYDWQDDLTTYFKVSQGWKSGGFNAEAPTEAQANESYDEEAVTAIEAGLKSRWLDERLQVNIAVFQNEIDDLQLSEVDAVGYSQILNAGESTVMGFEAELLFAVTDTLTANLNYGYLDADYDKFESGGIDVKDVAEFPYAPENTASAGLGYVNNIGIGELSARMDVSYIDNHVVYHNAWQAEVTKVESYSLVNARIGLGNIANSNFKVSIWGKNLTDEEYRVNGIPLGAALIVNYYGDPRTYGADVTYEF